MGTREAILAVPLLVIWLVYLLPATCVWIICRDLHGRIRGRRPVSIRIPQAELAPGPVSPRTRALSDTLSPPPSFTSGEPQPRADRPLDLLVYGATGFIGGLTCECIAKVAARRNLRWGIAGRDHAKLLKLRRKLVPDASASAFERDIEIAVVQADDLEGLTNMAKRSKVVVSCVGPYMFNGTGLVAACVEAKTDYCDCTVNTAWFRMIIDLYDEQARECGVRIVQMCGGAGAPWDLLVMELANKLKDANQEMKAITIFNRYRTSPSGGIIESMCAMVDGTFPQQSVNFDPFLRLPNGQESTCRVKERNQRFLGWSTLAKKWTAPSVLAIPNLGCIRRSNALNKYGRKLQYVEANIHHSFFPSFVDQIFTLLIFNMLILPPLRLILRWVYFPWPSSGPTEREMCQGHMTVEAVAEGSEGKQIRALMQLGKDPGNRATARILAESALALVDECEGEKGGVLTPAAAFGPELLRRLKANGTRFEIVSKPTNGSLLTPLTKKKGVHKKYE